MKQRGALNCPGHTDSYFGFAEVDGKGNWTGLDIDMCRAISAAIFGTDKGHLKVIPLSWAQRWPALQSGDVDIMIKTSGGTFTRDTELGFQFSNTYYLAETLVMVPAKMELKSLKDADGATACVAAGSVQERQLASYTAKIGITVEPVAIEKTAELNSAYFSGRCDLYVGSGQVLAVARTTASNPDDHVILSESLGLEPEVMLVRQGDDNWLDIANWTLTVLLMAEQENITSANVDEMKVSPPTTEMGKMLGVTPGFGTPLGLSDDWAYNVIKQVGNYSEIYERSLGKATPYKMDRGLNALWNAGGVLFPYMVD
ncbi:transporter substrate-binding domain-containing protein [Shinella sp.]|uniref:transporter substrate-binding domain-containing protein n=1 Tax=Shinella sp. TaxID=1870904 RepID=UPI0039E69DB8